MLTGRHLVLIEDDALMGSSLAQRLEIEGARVTWVKQAVRGISAVRTPQDPVDAVICDIRLPDGTGEDIFNAVSRSITPPPFLFITGQGEIDQAVRLLRAGGADYMTKPFDMPAFLGRLVQILRPEPGAALPTQTGISVIARHIDAVAEEFARHDRPVLIRGGRGLGKAGIARRIHELSDRRAAPFLSVNVVSNQDPRDRLADAVEAVADGSLFINGLDQLDEAGQNLMMSVVKNGKCRLIAACGNRIEDRVEAGAFRSDLLYTLVANEIVVPPLSQRREDAVWLAQQMFNALNTSRDAPLRGISDLALAAIRDHDWPGNGRELRSRILRAMDVATGDWIFPGDIFPEMSLEAESDEVQSLADARMRAERHQIILALEQTGGQIAKAARLLKVSRTTLWEKMQKLGL